MGDFDPTQHYIKLKGNKDYLPIAYRVYWVRDEYGKPKVYGIETELLRLEQSAGTKPVGLAVFKATLRDEEGRVVTTAHGSETSSDFGDYIEKAEVKSIGRALAYAGWGTVNAELDETDDDGEVHIADSGVTTKVRQITKEKSEDENLTCQRCAKPIRGFQIQGGPLVTPQEVAKRAQAFTGEALCKDCYNEAKKAAKASA